MKKVKIMTAEEVANFKTKMYSKGSEKKQLSSDYCARNIKDLIQKHTDFYDVYIGLKYEKYSLAVDTYNDVKAQKNQVFEDVKSGINHFCTCGAKLRYIEHFNFVGCSDYHNKKEQHININYQPLTEVDSYWEFKSDFEFSNNYINDFKNYYNLNFLMSSIIYEYLFEIYGQKCYSENLSYNNYQTGVNSAKQSKKEELIVKSICNNVFENVKDQVHFHYYIDNKYYVRIPDLICSKGNTVFVFDIKKHNDATDILKLDLYQRIVTEYLKTKHDFREVKSFHICYDKDSYDDQNTRSITINTLRNEF